MTRGPKKSENKHPSYLFIHFWLYGTAYYSGMNTQKKNNILTEDDDGNLQEKPGNLQKT